jgi:hypothetical protein
MKMQYTVFKGTALSVPSDDVASASVAADTGCRTNSEVGNQAASVVAMDSAFIASAATHVGTGSVPGSTTSTDTSEPIEVTGNEDPQPVVAVVRKKRGRKPKHRRLGRLLNIQHVQRAPVPVQSANSDTLSAELPAGAVVKKKRGRKPKNRCVEPSPAPDPPVAESHPEPSPSGELPGLSAVNNGYSADNASDTSDSVSRSSGCDNAQAVKQRRGRKRKTAVVKDADEEAMKQTKHDNSQTVWKVTTEQVNHDDVIPRLKMTSVRVSRDNSAAAKWLVRPARDSRQMRKRKADVTTDGRRDESRTIVEQGQSQAGQIPGSSVLRTHQNEAAVLQRANLFQPSLCSAVASWNAAALASVQLLRANESINGDRMVPVTSQHQVALTRLQDLQPMFGFGQVPSSAVTINDVGSEVMFVVGSDRRLGTVPIKLSDVIQLDSSGGGVGIESCETGILHQSKAVDAGIAGPGRIATVRPLDHGKLASHLLSQRVQM